MPADSFAPFLYAFSGAIVGGLVLFLCLQLWSGSPFSSRARPRADTPNVHLVEHIDLPNPGRQWSLEPLTEREMQVALLAAEGKRTADIARDLHISSYTVETHFKNIYKKLGISSRVELTRVLAQLGSSNAPPPK